MIKLRLQVPEDRERTACATLKDGSRVVATDIAVASISPLIAKKLGNATCDPLRVGGHPPLGTYRLLQAQALEPQQRDEYGTHALVFEPISGAALEAESFGRLGLLVYGGRLGKDGLLRRTQGGVRLSNLLLDRVLSALGSQNDLALELVTAKSRRWWAFWRHTLPTQSLSGEPPGRTSAPLDELTLLNAMLASAPRRPRKSTADFDTRDDDWRSRDRSRDSSSTSSDNFKGGGGDFGGAGASGRWDAPAAGGVDGAGRIIAAGAAGAALAGIAAAAASDGASAGAALTDSSGGTAY